MPDLHRLIVFLGAATLLAIAPGPGILYVLARTVAGGRREGILSSFGTFVGGLVHVVAAATGLSLILATSAVAFSIVKMAGAGYLIYLGIRMVIASLRDRSLDAHLQPRNRNPFWQGVVTEVLNPKTAIFFLAFIPQFVDRSSTNVFWQFLILGGLSVSLNTSADVIVTLLVTPISRRLKSSAALRRRQGVATGFTLIGLGAYVAISDSK